MRRENPRDALIEILVTYGWARTLDELGVLFEAQGVMAARNLSRIALDVAEETQDETFLEQQSTMPSAWLSQG
ncbi:MAG: hypothetical protein AAFZ80_00900 [Cyanobacteria bacterium P01_A01_bin.105]